VRGVRRVGRPRLLDVRVERRVVALDEPVDRVGRRSVERHEELRETVRLRLGDPRPLGPRDAEQRHAREPAVDQAARGVVGQLRHGDRERRARGDQAQELRVAVGRSRVGLEGQPHQERLADAVDRVVEPLAEQRHGRLRRDGSTRAAKDRIRSRSAAFTAARRRRAACAPPRRPAGPS
jgi:hypothetical protein